MGCQLAMEDKTGQTGCLLLTLATQCFLRSKQLSVCVKVYQVVWTNIRVEAQWISKAGEPALPKVLDGLMDLLVDALDGLSHPETKSGLAWGLHCLISGITKIRSHFQKKMCLTFSENRVLSNQPVILYCGSKKAKKAEGARDQGWFWNKLRGCLDATPENEDD